MTESANDFLFLAIGAIFGAVLALAFDRLPDDAGFTACLDHNSAQSCKEWVKAIDAKP